MSDADFEPAQGGPPRGGRRAWESLVHTLPRLGTAGSRSASLHEEPAGDVDYQRRAIVWSQFGLLRWIGTIGTLLIGLAALGAGALPVVGNPYESFPLGSIMSRMLQTSSALVFIGIGLLVFAWVFMAPWVGATRRKISMEVHSIRRTFIAWTLPLIFTAPVFTQDIYSYLAQGSIVANGMDPYSAGPVELLGTENHLARSVPFIWAESPSPYGPVALAIAAFISNLTGDSIALGVIAHRLVSLVGLIVAAWAIERLALRCHVSPTTALWLGILNPLTILHLVGGIHNESIMLGFLLVGMEAGLRGVDNFQARKYTAAWVFILASGSLIACAGMVKVTGFIALGFVGMAMACVWHQRGMSRWLALFFAVVVQVLVLIITVAVVSVLTGIGLGWVTGQGGAASIRSWMSITTDLGVIFGFIGMLLDLGDHTDALLLITRGIGLAIAAGFIVRMLFATLKGTIHPLGGLGVSTFVLVILFPVVHPWYLLWAIVPLSAWANRRFFRVAVVVYSVAMSFAVLPRGLALPPNTVLTIYFSAAIAGAVILGLAWFLLRKNGPVA